MRNEKIEQSIREKINKLTPYQQEHLKQHIAAKSKVFSQELSVREKYYPLKNLVPNIAQERALECYKSPKECDYPYPKYNFFTGGNGVGKTLDMTIHLAGISLGNIFLNQDYFNHKFYDVMKERRKIKPLIVWIVCEAADVSATGSVYTTIKEFIPTAKFEKAGSNYYKEIIIPAPEKGYHPTHCTIKTFEQDLVAFSGSNCDNILLNEPLPDKDKYDECVGRTRRGGYMSTFMTPLKAVAYMQKIVKDFNMKDMVCHTKGSIWENCCDVPGTRGVLKKIDIDAQIAVWKRNPITLRARVYGDFVHLAGAVFPIFDNDIHIIQHDKIPQKIEKTMMLSMAIDHHPKKPAVAVWMTLDALGVWRVVAEYPSDPWDEIIINEKSIRHFGCDFKLIESGKTQQFRYMRDSPEVFVRLGDPNAFRCEQAHNRHTIQQQYMDDCDLDININVDNSIELRHDKIRDLLYYDITRGISFANSPKLYIYQTCQNTINAFNYYLLKENLKPEEEWKDWIDVIGYILVTITQYNPTTVKELQTNKDDEYNKIYGSSKPDNKQYGMYSTFGI